MIAISLGVLSAGFVDPVNVRATGPVPTTMASHTLAGAGALASLIVKLRDVVSDAPPLDRRY
jgi:hypothetical protein